MVYAVGVGKPVGKVCPFVGATVTIVGRVIAVGSGEVSEICPTIHLGLSHGVFL